MTETWLSQDAFDRLQAEYDRLTGEGRSEIVKVARPEHFSVAMSRADNDALTLARQNGVDLVEISSTATPPVCRLVDFGKFRYEQAKKEKDSKKHQHASTVKEVQLSPRIDPHDLGVKITHAIDFLCEDMKVKVALKFRGREMAHQEFGVRLLERIRNDLEAHAVVESWPRLEGRQMVMLLAPKKVAPKVHHPTKPEAGKQVSPPESTAVGSK